MSPLTPARLHQWAIVGAALLLVGLVGVGLSALRDARPPACDAACVAVGQATKHARESHALDRAATLAVETVYVAARTTAQTAVAAVAKARTTPDSVTALLVAVATQGSALDAADSLLARAQRERASAERLQTATEAERDMWQARANLRPARASLSASALYDPLAGIPAASLDGELRLTSRVSAIVRAEQRFAPGERPRVYVGGKVAL